MGFVGLCGFVGFVLVQGFFSLMCRMFHLSTRICCSYLGYPLGSLQAVQSGLRSFLKDKISPHSLEVSAVTGGQLIGEWWIFNLEKNGWKFPVLYKHNP